MSKIELLQNTGFCNRLKLREIDTSFVLAMENLSNEAQKTADELLALVDNDKLDEAKTEVKQLAKEFREPRKALSEGMVKLWKLQAVFTAVSGAM